MPMLPPAARQPNSVLGFLVLRDRVVVDAVGFEPVSQAEFPANGQFSGDYFRGERFFRPTLVSESIAVARVCCGSSLDLEQGIFAGLQGISVSRNRSHGQVFLNRLRSMGIRGQSDSTEIALAERTSNGTSVRCRRECLDHVLILGDRH